MPRAAEPEWCLAVTLTPRRYDRFRRAHARVMSIPVAHSVMLILALFAMFCAIALFVPLVSAADEAAHYIYSAAVVRGQAGTLTPNLPEAIVTLDRVAACIAFQPNVTASCQAALFTTSPVNVMGQTNAGLYNPVFYLWTGLGSLILPSPGGLYVARILAAAVTATFLGWAISLALRETVSRWMSASVFLLLTPMTLYVGGVLNPSAWEIATMGGVVVSGFLLLDRDFRSRRPRWNEAHWLLAASGATLAVTRGLSPLLLAVALFALMVAAGAKSVLVAFRDWRTWIVGSVIGISVALSAVWILTHGTNYVGVERPTSFLDGVLSISVFYEGYTDQIRQMYGVLGWLDLFAPPILAFSWVAIAGFFIITSFSAASLRGRWAITIAFSAAILIPGVLAGLQWSGKGWQGRYTLPLIALVFILCAFLAERSWHGRGLDDGSRRTVGVAAVVVPIFFLVGSTIVAWTVVHRYLSGASGDLFADPSWSPPVSGGFLAAAFVAGTAILVAALIAPRGTERTPPSRHSHPFGQP